MQYQRFGDTIIVRMDKDEEILEQLKRVALRENIKLAEVSALGAVSEFTVGVYKVNEKKYYANEFNGYFEIVSLTGTISTMNGEYYAHLHMSAGDEKGQVFGGHLNRAIISATCEMVIRLINGQIDRYHDEEIGLNLFNLEQPSFLYNSEECPCPQGESAACPRYRDCDACVAYHRTPGNPPKTACEKRAEES